MGIFYLFFIHNKNIKKLFEIRHLNGQLKLSIDWKIYIIYSILLSIKMSFMNINM